MVHKEHFRTEHCKYLTPKMIQVEHKYFFCLSISQLSLQMVILFHRLGTKIITMSTEYFFFYNSYMIISYHECYPKSLFCFSATLSV